MTEPEKDPGHKKGADRKTVLAWWLLRRRRRLQQQQQPAVDNRPPADQTGGPSPGDRISDDTSGGR
jgi:hypothetical protein